MSIEVGQIRAMNRPIEQFYAGPLREGDKLIITRSIDSSNLYWIASLWGKTFQASIVWLEVNTNLVPMVEYKEQPGARLTSGKEK